MTASVGVSTTCACVGGVRMCVRAHVHEHTLREKETGCRGKSFRGVAVS